MFISMARTADISESHEYALALHMLYCQRSGPSMVCIPWLVTTPEVLVLEVCGLVRKTTCR